MSISSAPSPAERGEYQEGYQFEFDRLVFEQRTTIEASAKPDKANDQPNLYPHPALSNHPARSERRDLNAPAKLNRRLFDRIAGLIHRYSLDPLAQNEEGEYVTSDEKVQTLLSQEIEELKKLDPLIPLLLELKSKYKNQPLESGRLQVVSYKIVNPSIKDLNDIYLGPNQTDDYIEDLHRAIDAELSAHNAKLLNNHYKGGVFFIDHGPLNNHTPKEHAARMQAHEERIKELARQILIKYLDKRHKDLYERISEYSLRAVTTNQQQVNNLIDRLESNEEKIEIVFGFEDVNPNGKPIDTLSSILNAEREANMIAEEQKIDKRNGKQSERKEARKYSHEKLMVELISATLELYQHILDEDGKIKSEWKSFFKQNENDMVNMRRSMIQKYRKIDQFRESGEYREMTMSDRADFERKLQIFEDYYRKINLVDVLKKTTFENTGAYLERIQRIVEFIQKTQSQLAEENPDSESLRLALCQSSAELEISLKDKGYKTVHTTRTTIKALMSGDIAILVFGDNIGFAGLNQSGYENSALNLIDTLGLTGEEVQSVITTQPADSNLPTIDINQEKLRDLVRSKLHTVEHTPEFQQILLSIGDEGTSYLRKNQALLSGAFKGKAIASADGGDEDVVVYTNANGCEIPEDPIEIERTLFNISEQAKIRLAVVYGDMSFTPLPDYGPIVEVSQQTRFEIIRLMKAQVFAEFAHRKIKATGLTIVEMSRADEIMM